MDTKQAESGRPQAQKKYFYGQLNFAPTPITTKKAILKTFFGNPETEVLSVRFDQDDTMVAAACADGGIKVYNLSTGKLVANLMGSSGFSTPTTCVRWRPVAEFSSRQKGLLNSGNADGSVIQWHIASGMNQFKPFLQGSNFLGLSRRKINKDGLNFATAGSDFAIRIYDDERKEVIHTYEPAQFNGLGHSNRVFSVKFLLDQPNVLISGGWDGNVLIWDIRDKHAQFSINGPSLSGDSLDIQDGKILAGSYRTKQQVQLYDFKQRSLLLEVPWVPGEYIDNFYVYAAQFNKINTETFICGSSGLNEVKVFDQRHEYKPTIHIQQLQSAKGVFSIDHGNTSNKFAFGGGEGVVYVCQLLTCR